MIFRHTRLIMGTALLAVVFPAVPAMAQDADEARIKKLEAEVRALQRKVFPGGDGRYFEPQIDSSTPVTPVSTSPSSTTAVTDILARLDALEASLQRLTGQVELNSNVVAGLETRIAALEAGAVPATVPAVATGQADNRLPSEKSSTAVAAPAIRPPSAPAVSGPSAQRLAAVQAIAKPQTDDPGDDEYSYGFRLWSAGFYPEAQQQLAMFVEKYPKHPHHQPPPQ